MWNFQRSHKKLPIVHKCPHYQQMRKVSGSSRFDTNIRCFNPVNRICGFIFLRIFLLQGFQKAAGSQIKKNISSLLSCKDGSVKYQYSRNRSSFMGNHVSYL